MRLQTLVSIIALIALGCFLVLVGLEWYEGRQAPPSPTDTSKNPTATEKDKPKTKRKHTPQLKEMLHAGERAQKLTQWEDAAKEYKRAQEALSLSEGNADDIRRKLNAVQDVILAEKLAGEKKWDDAVLHYQAALDEIENRSYVERVIRATKIKKKIDEQETKADQLAKEGKWAEARAALKAALKTAQKADIETDIRAKLKRLGKLSQGIGNRLERVNRAIDACTGNDSLYGVLALCYYFEKNPDYISDRQVIESRKNQAAGTIAARPKDFPSPVAVADTEIVTVQRPGSKPIEGILLEARGSRLVLNVLDGPRFTLQTVQKTARTTVQKRVVPAGELNESRASHLLTTAVQSLERKDRTKALAALGCLLHYFPKSEMATDRARQQWLIGATSPRVAAAYGRTIEDLIGRTADELGDMCPACLGTGLRKCSICNGTGTRMIRCVMCQGTGAIACYRCSGTKKVLSRGKMIKCPTCKGTGKSTCTPCRGEGKLPQGCTACDIDHMVKCTACGGTGRGDRKVVGTVTGPVAPVKADTPKQRKNRMEWVFDICTSRQDYYAMFAAASHYERLQDYKQFADVIAARKEEARSGIKEQKESAKAKGTTPEKYDVITTQDKKKIIGHIARETDSAVTIEVKQGEKTSKRIILKKSIRSIDKNAVGEGDSANALLEQAAAWMQDSDPQKDLLAMACIGRIMHDHADSEIAANEEVQKHVISNTSAEVFLKTGGTLNSLLSTAVQRTESICFDCVGKGKFPCDVCKGGGTRVVPCKWCRGAKRIFCRVCGGSGRGGDTPEEDKPCGKCRGTGWMSCPHCKGSGTEVARCSKCNGAGEFACKKCGGKGRVDNQPGNP